MLSLDNKKSPLSRKPVIWNIIQLAPVNRVLREHYVRVCSASQESPRLLWNYKVLFHAHKGTTPVPVQNQIHQIHTLQIYLPKIRFNIIITTTPEPSKWAMSFRASNQNFVSISHVPVHSRCPAVCYVVMLRYVMLLKTCWDQLLPVILLIVVCIYSSQDCYIYDSLLKVIRPTFVKINFSVNSYNYSLYKLLLKCYWLQDICSVKCSLKYFSMI